MTTELHDQYEIQRKQEIYDDTFKQIKNYNKRRYYNAFPGTVETIIKFGLKHKHKLHINRIEVHWFTYKKMFCKPERYVDFVLIGWRGSEVTKIDCNNSFHLVTLEFTSELQRYIKANCGTTHKSGEYK